MKEDASCQEKRARRNSIIVNACSIGSRAPACLEQPSSLRDSDLWSVRRTAFPLTCEGVIVDSSTVNTKSCVPRTCHAGDPFAASVIVSTNVGAYRALDTSPLNVFLIVGEGEHTAACAVSIGRCHRRPNLDFIVVRTVLVRILLL